MNMTDEGCSEPLLVEHEKVSEENRNEIYNPSGEQNGNSKREEAFRNEEQPMVEQFITDDNDRNDNADGNSYGQSDKTNHEKQYSSRERLVFNGEISNEAEVAGASGEATTIELSKLKNGVSTTSNTSEETNFDYNNIKKKWEKRCVSDQNAKSEETVIDTNSENISTQHQTPIDHVGSNNGDGRNSKILLLLVFAVGIAVGVGIGISVGFAVKQCVRDSIVSMTPPPLTCGNVTLVIELAIWGNDMNVTIFTKGTISLAQVSYTKDQLQSNVIGCNLKSYNSRVSCNTDDRKGCNVIPEYEQSEDKITITSKRRTYIIEKDCIDKRAYLRWLLHEEIKLT